MKFIERLPFFYYEDGNVNSIQEALESEDSICKSKIEDTIKQLYIDTATWGIALWEGLLDIKPSTEDVEIRRKNIKAKLRSRGVVTPQKIINITNSYTNSDVDLEEFPAEYYFIICMVLNSITEEEFVELKKIVDSIKPCHLDTIYKWMIKERYSIFLASVTIDKEVITLYPFEEYEEQIIYFLGVDDDTILEIGLDEFLVIN